MSSLQHCQQQRPPDAKVWMYLVYLKYWTLNLMPLMVCPKVFRPNYSNKAETTVQERRDVAARPAPV